MSVGKPRTKPKQTFCERKLEACGFGKIWGYFDDQKHQKSNQSVLVDEPKSRRSLDHILVEKCRQISKCFSQWTKEPMKSWAHSGRNISSNQSVSVDQRAGEVLSIFYQINLPNWPPNLRNLDVFSRQDQPPNLPPNQWKFTRFWLPNRPQSGIRIVLEVNGNCAFFGAKNNLRPNVF